MATRQALRSIQSGARGFTGSSSGRENSNEWRLIVRILISAVVALIMLALALPAFAQQQTPTAEGCDWYWWNKYNPAGGWEYWCWSPLEGWWYSASDDGTQQTITHGG